MVVVWNMLPGLIVEADTIIALKRLLDWQMDMQERDGYESHAGRGV